METLCAVHATRYSQPCITGSLIAVRTLSFAGGALQEQDQLLLPVWVACGAGGMRNAFCGVSGNRSVMPDDHSELVPPLPIPNRTVKRLCADDSAATSVKVGHRQAVIPENPRRPTGAGGFCFGWTGWRLKWGLMLVQRKCTAIPS